MSTGIVITIVVIAAVVFGAIVVLTTARSSEVRGAGALSRETRSRDRKATISGSTPTGREVEAASRSTEVAIAAPVAVEPFVAPDEEALGVSRRMFFNRSAVTLMAASLGAFGASVVAFLWKGADWLDVDSFDTRFDDHFEHTTTLFIYLFLSDFFGSTGGQIG